MKVQIMKIMIRFATRRRLFQVGLGILLALGLTCFANPNYLAQSRILFAQNNEFQIYVAPNGKDSNPGTLTAPIASIRRAQELARQATASKRQNVTVYLRGGLYRLTNTLNFDERDSGAEGYTVTYAAYAKERPVLSGGVPISNWKQTSNELFTTRVNLRFRQLYTNGQRGIRARFPNGNNYLRLRQWFADPKPDIQNTRDENRVIVVNAADLKGFNITPESKVEMVIHRDWAENRLRVESLQIRGDRGLVTVREPERQMAFGSLYPFKYPRQAYHLENSLSFVDAPGEWFLEPDGDLFYRPRAGETLASLKAVAPNLDTLIQIMGKPNNPVKNLVFRGLTFTETTWLIPDQYGKVGFQGPTSFIPAPNNQPIANTALTAAVKVRYARNLRFTRNRIQNSGGNGITFGVGVQNSAIVGNIFKNIAASGIVLHGPTTRTQLSYARPNKTNSQVWAEDFKGRSPLSEQNRNNQINNNLITQVGVDYTDNCGIFGAYIADTKIENNQLSKLPYTGISLGWGWTSETTDQSNNLVRANDISEAMQMLTDGGGIYHLSRSNGTQIIENYIHAMKLSPWAERRVLSAIMIDSGSSGLLVARNVFRNFSTEAKRKAQDSFTQILLSTPREANRLEANEDISPTIAKQVIAKAGLEPAYRDLQTSL
jgi:hypothetical protein